MQSLRGARERARNATQMLKINSNPKVHVWMILTAALTQLRRIIAVNPWLPLPIGLTSLLFQTFQCGICQDPITPPAIFARCCKRIIGCHQCVYRWYQGEVAKKCPLCRGDRGVADTCQVNGLDKFLCKLSDMLGGGKAAQAPVQAPVNDPDSD